MNWFKRLLASKISVTIVYPGTRKRSTKPEIVEEKIIHKKNQSNFRFVEETEVDYNGETTTWYLTQELINDRWSYVSGSNSKNKEKAMQLHLHIVNVGGLEPKRTRTVLWEGLTTEETKTWVELQL